MSTTFALKKPCPSKDSIDNAIDDLVKEAKSLFHVLDSMSERIRDLEKQLRDLNANFEFSIPLREEKASIKPLEERHQEIYDTSNDRLGHQCSDCWYLSWESDEKSKSFRLFLLSKLKETIVWRDDGSAYEPALPIEGEIVFKRPLIETDLQTRLKFSEYLPVFIVKFTEYMKTYRLSIEGSEFIFIFGLPPS